MKKKVLSMLLTAAMILSLFVACGAEETSQTPTEAPAKPTEAPAAPTEAPAKPTEAPVVPTEAPVVPTEAPVVVETLPDAKYYYSFDGDASGLTPKQNVNDSSLTTMDERVFTVEEEFIFTNGVKNDCLWLDGTFGARVNDIKPIDTDTYTISFWVWAARLSNYGTTVQFGNGMAEGTTEHWLSFTTLDSSKVFPTVWSRNAATGVFPYSIYENDTMYGRKEWAHIALVCDDTDITDLNGNMVLNARLYVNGVLSPNVINVTPGVFTAAETEFAFLLGVNPWDTIFKGAIDELYIFDQALTEGQVATLFADGDAKSVPQKSTEPEPEVIKDYSNAATTGTVIGSKDCTGVFGDAYSDIVEVPVGETVETVFKNYTSNKDFAATFSVILQNVAEGHSAADNADYKEYAVVAASEGFEVQTKASDLTIERNTFNQFNPAIFANDTDLATIYLSVTNNGDKANVSIKGVCADGVTRYLDVVSIPVDGPLYYCLTVNGAFIDIQEKMEATGLVLGTTDCTTPFWSVFSDTVAVPVGETVTVNFKNYTAGANYYENFLVILQNVADAHAAADNADYKEYAVVRADNWGWGAGYDGIAVAECDWVWDTFTKDINGADVQLSITNNGSTADVVAVVTTKGGKVYNQKYTGIAVDGDLYYCLSLEKAWLDIQGTVIGTTDCTTPFWSVFSDTVAVPAGESVNVKFRNFTSGINNYENFLVVLQNVADAHAAADNADYKEYAVVRADNWGWGAGYDGIAVPECDWVWDTFTKDINGALVDLTVMNNGTTADVVAVVTTVDGRVFNQKYTGIAIDGDLHFCLTLEKAWLNIF